MVRKIVLSVICLCLLPAFFSCAVQEGGETDGGKVKLMVLNPGHYHAALVQKSMYDEVAPEAYVYAPAGPEVKEYLKRIESFNNRSKEPTRWDEQVYAGDDYLEKMLIEKPGNVVVMSGNNQKKTMYIKSAVDAGLNVFSDKPMCIDADGFRLLEQAFDTAEQNGVLLYDIMTERFNVLCILQKILVLNKSVFGELKKGSVDEPAVIKESVHHFFKYVSGTPIKRPTWYFDSTQQGEGLVDVTTHLIDLMMWTCFSEEAIDYRNDVSVLQARRWPTMLTREQYEKVTRAPDFPKYLKGKLNNEGVLPYYSNGEMVYRMKDIYMKLAVSWNFQAPEGGGDTHHSLFRGSKANVIIRQGKEENYRPELYVEPAPGKSGVLLAASLKRAVTELQSKYPGLALKRLSNSWQVIIPDEHRIGHEAHFRIVTEKYLQYLAQGRLPDWEVSNMIAKYYITTRALELASQ
ncbi:MAG: putative oxidoreductase C-terminal domain-containing protein [Planctomycetota bacterium]|jgi:predicted dehydrogenase